MSLRIDAQREDVIRLHGEGKTDGAMAAELGITRNSVIGMRHRLGLACNRRLALSMSAGAVRKRLAREFRAKPAPRKKAVDKSAKLETAPPPTPPPPPPPVRKTAFAPDWHPIMRLTPHSCRWPNGDPSGEDFYYCCSWKGLERPYCDWHTEMAKRVRVE